MNTGMKKKLFGMLLMSTMLIAFPSGVNATQVEELEETVDTTETEMPSDTSEADKAWTLDENGVLTISLSGRITEADAEEWKELRENVVEIHLEEGVTAIEDGVFADLDQLQYVYLPDSLEEIGAEAFRDCKSLNSLTISENVTRIGDRAFEETGLLSIIFLGDAPEIGEEIFDGVRNLHIMYPAGLSSWSEEVRERVGNRRCRWIDSECLGGFCGNGVEWTFQNGMLTISGEGVVEDFQIHCDEKTFEIGCSSPWNDIANSVTTLIVEPGITSLGNLAFSQFDHMTSVNLPEGLESIGKNTFNGCMSLEEITLPGSLKVLNEYAFSNCGALERIYWPKGLLQVEDNAFKSCANLKEIYFFGTLEEWDLVQIEENGNGQLLAADIQVQTSADAEQTEEMEETTEEQSELK